MNIELELLPKQISFLTSQEKINIFRGGIRSGKTFIGSLKTILKCVRGRSVLHISPTFAMARDNVVASMEEVGEMVGIPVHFQASKQIIKVGRGYVIIRSGDAPERVRGFGAHDMWVDEGSFFDKGNKAFLRGLGRLSKSGDDREIYVTSSPSGRDWVYDLSQSKDAFLVQQSLRDNKFLDLSLVQLLEQQYAGDFARQEIDGEIVEFGGSVFDSSKIDIVDAVTISHMVQSFDLGFTDTKKSDYSAHAICAITTDGQFVILSVQRWKFKAPQTKERMKSIIASLPEMPTLVEISGGGRPVYDDLINDGLNLIPITPHRSKVSRAMPLASAIEQGRVISKRGSWNDDLFNEMDSMSIDDKHEHDDMIDAVVMCYNHANFQAGSIKSGGMSF